WTPRPLYAFGVAGALFGAGALHSSAGLLFGLVALFVRWRATLLINQKSQTITDLAKNTVAGFGAERVGVDLETSDFKVILIGQNRPSPFGVRAMPDYSISAVYICDAFFAVYAGTSFSLRIPAKPNAVSGGKPNGIPGRTRTPSERSDAGISIVQEVFGFVKKNCPERSEGTAPQARKGAWGKDGTSCPHLSTQRPRSANSASAKKLRIIPNFPMAGVRPR
ncbi:MAG TPA: hypothetical protein VK776_10290, partial [Bryobacteraceae bacterium]|nr:hypothetical protein [Bryobacteraceae bacterium]